MIEKTVMINGGLVSYEALEIKETIRPSVLILSGGGGSNVHYHPLMARLAEKGYRIFLPELPGFSSSEATTRVIPLEEWGRWIGTFAEEVIGEQFVLVCHSFTARMALKYLSEESCQDLCLEGIFIAPGLTCPWQEIFWRTFGWIFAFILPRTRKFKDMTWVRNKEARQTAQLFISATREKPLVTCQVLIGRRDPIGPLFTGWKTLGCEKQTFNGWGHSPQLRAPGQLAEAIDNFIKRRLIR